MLGNMDIEIYLIEKEFKLLKYGKSDGQTTMPMMLCGGKLEDFHHIGVDDRSIQIYNEKIKDFSDGINVKYTPDIHLYEVGVNDRALENIERNGWWGSRYGMGEKIKISLQKCPFPTEEEIKKLDKKFK